MKCCERDFNNDGNCDRHPIGAAMTKTTEKKCMFCGTPIAPDRETCSAFWDGAVESPGCTPPATERPKVCAQCGRPADDHDPNDARFLCDRVKGPDEPVCVPTVTAAPPERPRMTEEELESWVGDRDLSVREVSEAMEKLLAEVSALRADLSAARERETRLEKKLNAPGGYVEYHDLVGSVLRDALRGLPEEEADTCHPRPATRAAAAIARLAAEIAALKKERDGWQRNAEEAVGTAMRSYDRTKAAEAQRDGLREALTNISEKARNVVADLKVMRSEPDSLGALVAALATSTENKEMTRDNRGGGGHTRKHALEIDRVLVLSTAHLPESVATGIEPRMDRVASMTGEYGWLVYVGNEAFEPEYLELNDLLEAKEVLLKLCEFARKQKCDYLLFDRDGDTVGEFPTFEW